MRISTRLDTNGTPFCRTVKIEFHISRMRPPTCPETFIRSGWMPLCRADCDS